MLEEGDGILEVLVSGALLEEAMRGTVFWRARAERSRRLRDGSAEEITTAGLMEFKELSSISVELKSTVAKSPKKGFPENLPTKIDIL